MQTDTMRTIFLPILIAFLLLASPHESMAQRYTSVDIVNINARYENEAMYFYRENWQAFRKAALEKGIISGYEMLRTETDSTNHFQLILMTEYPDKASFEKREDHFGPIMKAISPNGPKMLNSIDRKVFLEYLSGYDAQRVLSNRKRD